MAEANRSVLDSRRDQIFPVLGPADIERLQRFGQPRRYAAGAQVVRAGYPAEGLLLVLRGEIAMLPHGAPEQPIVVHGPGSFLGELAQLSGRPSLVDGIARSEVEALAIPSTNLRTLMIQDAELGERIMRALILRRVGLLELHVGPIIVGQPAQRDVLRLQGFLARNGHPYRTLDPDHDEDANTLIERFQLSAADLPVVLCVNGELLRKPTERQLAACIGLDLPLDPSRLYDVAIVGAGPAGLAAAVYATSEGLSVLVLDCRAFGGQAGASARIENYLGFPTGISGLALMARAYNQAQKFGAEIVVPEEAVRLEQREEAEGRLQVLQLASQQSVRARAVVIASGAEYRRLDVAGLADYEGSHVHYWASPLEARLCAGEEVVLVGGGNSAGQAAVYLSAATRRVWMLVRASSLSDDMSRYLCDRIAAQPNISVLLDTEVVGLEGADGVLQRVRWRDRRSGEETLHAIAHLFLMIGAAPNTAWLGRSGVALDDKGFVQAPALEAGRRPFETNFSGVFAVGDVRSGSVKRVAASVGEGSQVVSALHRFLGDQRGPLSLPVQEISHA